jgi:hypothetical protein
MSTDTFPKVRAILDQYGLCHRAEVMARARRTYSSCSPWLPPRTLQVVALVTMGYQQRTVSRWVPLQTRTIEAHLAAARQTVPGCSFQASTRQLAAWFWAHIPCCTHAALVIVDSMTVPASLGDSPARRLEGLASTHLPLAVRTRTALTLLAPRLGRPCRGPGTRR